MTVGARVFVGLVVGYGLIVLAAIAAVYAYRPAEPGYRCTSAPELYAPAGVAVPWRETHTFWSAVPCVERAK